MTANNTTKWIDVLPKFVKNYNNSEHSVIKKKPKNVTIKDEKRIIQDAIDKTVSIIPSIKVGDKVRLAVPKQTFKKEGKRFTDKVFTVSKVNRKSIIVEGSKKRYSMEEVLIVPKESKSLKQKNIVQAKKADKVRRTLRKEGVNQKNFRRKSTRKAAKLSRDLTLAQSLS